MIGAIRNRREGMSRLHEKEDGGLVVRLPPALGGTNTVRCTRAPLRLCDKGYQTWSVGWLLEFAMQVMQPPSTVIQGLSWFLPSELCDGNRFGALPSCNQSINQSVIPRLGELLFLATTT